MRRSQAHGSPVFSFQDRSRGLRELWWRRLYTVGRRNRRSSPTRVTKENTMACSRHKRSCHCTVEAETLRKLLWRIKSYGWTKEYYEDQSKKQNGCCAICHRPSIGRRLHADHKHSNPPVPRGFLCGTCNRVLGMFQDRVDLFESALAYLKKYQSLYP